MFLRVLVIGSLYENFPTMNLVHCSLSTVLDVWLASTSKSEAAAGSPCVLNHVVSMLILWPIST